MKPVAGLDGLHLAGNMAKEGGHVPLSWELINIYFPLLGKGHFTFFRNNKWYKIRPKYV